MTIVTHDLEHDEPIEGATVSVYRFPDNAVYSYGCNKAEFQF